MFWIDQRIDIKFCMLINTQRKVETEIPILDGYEQAFPDTQIFVNFWEVHLIYLIGLVVKQLRMKDWGMLRNFKVLIYCS